MIKILVKALILVCIILSIYFIVNPSACSNLINGRVVNTPDKAPVVAPADQQHSELFTPAGDPPMQPAQEPTEPAPVAQPEQPAQQTPATPQPQEPAQTQPAQPAANQSSADTPAPAVTDTHSLQDQAAKAEAEVYTQAQVDYAIASRYVELENEYIKQNKDMKKAAQEISCIVMDDFELTPGEWEAFLQRATVDNLFDKVRQEKAAKN